MIQKVAGSNSGLVQLATGKNLFVNQAVSGYLFFNKGRLMQQNKGNGAHFSYALP